VNDEALKLTAYFGEHERVGRRLLSDALLELYERRGVHTAVLMRGIEGFGGKHRLHTARLLTLSEDLPLVSVAVDSRQRIEEALPEAGALIGRGLITLEPTRMLTGQIVPFALPEAPHDASRLTVVCGRAERAGGRPASLAVVELMHDRGIAGATVFLGVDGMVHGRRERAAFLSRNADVPLMIVALGNGAAIAALLPQLGALLDRPLFTLERVQLCKRDGVLLAEPRSRPAEDELGLGLGIWEKLTVYAGEQARHGKRPLYLEIVRRLREAGAAGATVLRGIWGYSGEHPPHGDRLLSITRHVPAVTVVVDRPEAMRTWWRIVDELTDEAGLVTTETVTAFQAIGADPRRPDGGLGPAGELR
jgi:PII-like signaling protein